MVQERTCDYTGEDIEPGTGKMYVKTDGTILWFKDAKAEKNYFLGRESRDLEWVGYEEDEAAEEEAEPEAETEPEEAEEQADDESEDEESEGEEAEDADEETETEDEDAADEDEETEAEA